MKRITIFLTGVLFLAIAANAFAEENIGFIQRLKNRFMKKPAQTAAAAKTAAPLAAKKSGAAVTAPAPKPALAPISREDLIDTIKQTLDTDPEIILGITDLKAVKDGDKTSYTFKGSGLEALDDNSIQGLADTVIGEIGKRRSEVINDQMNVLRQIQQVQTQQAQIQQVQAASRQAQAASRQVAQAQSIPKGPPPSAAGGPGRAGGPGGPGGPSSAAGRR